MSYEIKLPFFEGPFDLLLFFIERDELDIHDIPISKITDEFLAYLRQMEQMNIEVASEFILVAATLMRIKSKMLLPRPELDEEGNEIDPREELVKHLLEYKKFKSVISSLSEMEAEESEKEKRGNIIRELRSLAAGNNVEAELQNVDLYKLLKVFSRVLSRYEEEQNKPRHEVVEFPYTIADQKKFIKRKLFGGRRISFLDIINDNPDKIAVIFNFLAILEMLQSGDLMIRLGEGFNNFWLEETEELNRDHVEE